MTCLDLEFFGAKAGESPAFRQLLPRVVEHYGEHFQVVMGDAGLCAAENAALVRSLGKALPVRGQGQPAHPARPCGGEHPVDGLPVRWERVCEKFRDALVHGPTEACLPTGA